MVVLVGMAENLIDESLFEYDELQIFFGEDYYVTDKIIIHQPTLGDIIEFGEKRFYSMVSTLCANKTSFRLQLWDAGKDWNKIRDFDLFMSLINGYTQEDTYLLFLDCLRNIKRLMRIQWIWWKV